MASHSVGESFERIKKAIQIILLSITQKQSLLKQTYHGKHFATRGLRCESLKFRKVLYGYRSCFCRSGVYYSINQIPILDSQLGQAELVIACSTHVLQPLTNQGFSVRYSITCTNGDAMHRTLKQIRFYILKEREI